MSLTWFYSFFVRDYGPSLDDVMEDCVVPLILNLRAQYFNIIVVNILYNVTLRSYTWSENTFHTLSIALGASLICELVFQDDLLFLFIFLLMGYWFLKVAFLIRKLTSFNTVYVTQIGFVCFILYCEIYHQQTVLWLKSRGVIMIAIMKIISLASDADKGAGVLSFIKYSGYLLCPANSIFGPWIQLEEYTTLRSKSRKTTLNIKWVATMIKATVVASFQAAVSNCYAYYLIPQNSSRWAIAYRKAFSYRASHYFVSYFSECVMIAAGFNKLSGDALGRWEYRVTCASDMEVPTLCASRIYSWNPPLVRFLKLHVFGVFTHNRRILATFVTLFFIYLLHGMNVEVIFIVFSSAGFAFFQSVVGSKLSYNMNTCIKFRTCINCTHKYKGFHPFSVGCNLLFIIINGLNLAYVGCLVDMLSPRKSFYETFVIWRNVEWTSWHAFSLIYAIGCFLVNLKLK